MASVFPGGQKHAGTFRADLLTMVIGGISAPGMLFQQVGYQFEQQIQTFYEVASNNVYWIGGRAEGQATVSRLIGPTNAKVKTLLNAYRDPCNPANLGMRATTTQCLKNSELGTNQGVHEITLKSAVLRGLSGNVAARDVVFTQNLSLMFVDMEDSLMDAAA